MNDHPKISIIIPSYNNAKYLREAVGSALKQTYKNIEVIIIDDGSTDNSREVAESFRDPRIIYLWQENEGPAGARNKGIEKTKGEYVAFLDSDDLWEKDKLKKQLDFMEKNPETGMLGTASREMTDDGKIRGREVFPEENKILQKILIRYNPFIQSSVMARREVFKRVGLYDRRFRESEDYELWLRIAADYKIGNLKEPLTIKRYKREGLSPEKDKEQLYFALKARMAAISRGQYKKWSYFYLLGSWIFMEMPFFLRRLVRRYLLGKKFYKI